MTQVNEIYTWKSTLVCLVPREGKSGITCHEYTLCDCQVLKIYAELEKFQTELNRAKADAESASLVVMSLNGHNEALMRDLRKAISEISDLKIAVSEANEDAKNANEQNKILKTALIKAHDLLKYVCPDSEVVKENEALLNGKSL